jgi:hypothetical protein
MSATRVRALEMLEMSFEAKTPVTGSRIVVGIGIVPSANAIMRGTMISMVLTMSRSPGIVHRLEVGMK